MEKEIIVEYSQLDVVGRSGKGLSAKIKASAPPLTAVQTNSSPGQKKGFQYCIYNRYY